MVEQIVNELNAVMPPNGPRYVYVRKPTQFCIDSITVCSGDITFVLPDGRIPVGATYLNHKLGHARVILDQIDPFMSEFTIRLAVTCHEMVHAVTGIFDNYGARPNESCVWGSLTGLGPFDIEYLWLVYGSDPDNDRDRKRRKR